MDPGWPEATAVAVVDGKIVSVGVTFDDLKPWLDKYPYEVDDRFKDKVIYPGFVEAHTHPVMGSLAISRPSLSYFPMRNPYGADIPGVKTRAEAIARLKQYVADATPDETMLTWGYDVARHGRRLRPRRARRDLDDAADHRLGRLRALRLRQQRGDREVRHHRRQDRRRIGAGRDPDGQSNGQFLGTDAARLILPPGDRRADDARCGRRRTSTISAR